MHVFSRLHVVFTALSLPVLTTCVAIERETFDRAACQTPNKSRALEDCPLNTLVVGPNARYATIQSAVLSIPNNTIPYTILIQPGIYKEQVNITRRSSLTLLGVTSAPNDHNENAVTVLWADATSMSKKDNAFTSTLTVASNLDASLTGKGPMGHTVPEGTPFGNVDFRAYNIDFINRFDDRSAGPSLAVSVSYANAGFYYCGVRSYQDTVSSHALFVIFFFVDYVLI
jgi:pectin methylesterase-like acyl-CoA thioesterase